MEKELESWEIDFHWLKIQHYVKDSMLTNELPDIRAMLFMIGIQELGQVKENFSKEEKQDLMHIAVCTLLEGEGYFEFVGRDEDGWPHWENVKAFTINGSTAQEELLKSKIIEYFEIREQEHSVSQEEE